MAIKSDLKSQHKTLFHLYTHMIPLMLLGVFASCKSEEPIEEIIDASCNFVWYLDQDQDGKGWPEDSICADFAPTGYVDNDSDDDDSQLPLFPGQQKAYTLGSTRANYGFLLYTPTEITEIENLPVVVFLHGGGQVGDSRQDPADLQKILWGGPAKVVSEGKWAQPFPMFVASPQSPREWYADGVHEFISFLIDHLQIDTNRIYLTGLSMGAKGTFDYISQYGDDSYIAAAIPIAGWGNTETGARYHHIPIWAFHGKLDEIVPFTSSLSMIQAINDQDPQFKAKLTLYPDAAHDSWTQTYDGSGMGKEDPSFDAFDIAITDWFYSYEKVR